MSKLNLENDTTAFDTYQCVINKLKQALVESGKHLQATINLLNRKNLKQLIMTAEYRVSYQTARNRYMHCVAQAAINNPEYNALLNSDLFKDIFDLLRGGVVAKLFFCKTIDA